MCKIAIIGAGASGMTAAIEAARCGAEVTLFEKNDRAGKKILATGNGKCNLSNLCFDMEQYYCSDRQRLSGFFGQFSVKDTIDFFESMGILIRDKNGYLYPYSEQASSVLDALRTELNRLKVTILAESEITAVTYSKDRSLFQIKNAAGKVFLFPEIILACGSPASVKKGEGLSGYLLAKQLGHQIKKVVPGLVQLKSEEIFIKALAGVRCQAKIMLVINGQITGVESGELQFTEFGVSGIPVFQISRMAAYAFEEGKKVQIHVDFFPHMSADDFDKMLQVRYQSQKDKNLEQFLNGTVNKKINMVMLKQAGLKPEQKTSEVGWKAVVKLMQSYRSFKISVSRTNTVDKAQICAGGVPLSQVSDKLESQKVKGLFFAGEILDVDGKCGGYNLQWAWTSGYIAGKSAARCT